MPVLTTILSVVVIHGCSCMLLHVVAFGASHSNLRRCWSWPATCMCWWCFSYHLLAQILYLHTLWSWLTATCTGRVFLQAICTNTLLTLVQLALCSGGCIWWLHVVVVCGGGTQLYKYVAIPVVVVGIWRWQFFHLWVNVNVVGLWPNVTCSGYMYLFLLLTSTDSLLAHVVILSLLCGA